MRSGPSALIHAHSRVCVSYERAYCMAMCCVGFKDQTSFVIMSPQQISDEDARVDGEIGEDHDDIEISIG